MLPRKDVGMILDSKKVGNILFLDIFTVGCSYIYIGNVVCIDIIPYITRG